MQYTPLSNLCTGPFFLKAISPNIIQCLFSSTIALRAFQSLKQNEDKSRDLSKRGKKAYSTRFRRLRETAKSTRDRALHPKRRDAERTKEKADPRCAGTERGIHHYKNTLTTSSPYGNAAFVRTRPVCRWEIHICGVLCGGRSARGLMQRRERLCNSHRCWLDQSFAQRESSILHMGKTDTQQIRIRFRVNPLDLVLWVNSAAIQCFSLPVYGATRPIASVFATA